MYCRKFGQRGISGIWCQKKTSTGLIGAGGQMVDDAYDRVLMALQLVEYDYYHQ